MTAPAVAAPVVAPVNLSVTVDQAELADALKFVTGAIPSRSQLPVLMGARIEATPAGVHISAFDYETSASQLIPSDGATDGATLVNAKLLNDIVKGLDKGSTVRIASKTTAKTIQKYTGFDAATNKSTYEDSIIFEGDVVVESSGVEYTLKTLPITEYPTLPAPQSEITATFTGAVLTEMLRAAVAAGRDDTLPVLTGLCLAERDGVLEVAATDRYRLTVFDTGVPVNNFTGKRVLVPARAIAFAAKHLGKAPEIHLGVTAEDGGYITLTAGTRTMTTRTLDGEFPKYRALLPDTSSGELWVSTKTLVKAVERVTIVASRTSPVRLTCGGDDATVVEAGGVEEATSKATVTGTGFEGEGLTIAFNPTYLLDGMKAIGSDVVNCRFNSPTKPAVWYDRDRPQFQYLLMPVRLAG